MCSYRRSYIIYTTYLCWGVLGIHGGVSIREHIIITARGCDPPGPRRSGTRDQGSGPRCPGAMGPGARARNILDILQAGSRERRNAAPGSKAHVPGRRGSCSSEPLSAYPGGARGPGAANRRSRAKRNPEDVNPRGDRAAGRLFGGRRRVGGHGVGVIGPGLDIVDNQGLGRAVE